MLASVYSMLLVERYNIRLVVRAKLVQNDFVSEGKEGVKWPSIYEIGPEIPESARSNWRIHCSGAR